MRSIIFLRKLPQQERQTCNELFPSGGYCPGKANINDNVFLQSSLGSSKRNETSSITLDLPSEVKWAFWISREVSPFTFHITLLIFELLIYCELPKSMVHTITIHMWNRRGHRCCPPRYRLSLRSIWPVRRNGNARKRNGRRSGQRRSRGGQTSRWDFGGGEGAGERTGWMMDRIV